jgi:hypothetical protein
MDLVMMVLHLCVVGNFLRQFQLLEDVVLLDALQNLGEQNQGVHLPYLDEVRLFLVVVVVDVELRHLLKMDYYQDAVDVELRHLLKMDYCQGAELLALQVLTQLALQLLLQMQLLLHLAQPFQHREMP